MSLLSIIIVNYRSGALLNACLDAIAQAAPAIEPETLIVNNDPADDLSAVRARGWPRLQIIQNDCNLGFGAAANRGFQRSRGEFILLLNPDVRTGTGSIGALLETMQQNPKAGLALPQLQNPDGSLQYSCRRFYTYRTLFLRRGLWKTLFSSHPHVARHLMLDWDHQSLQPVDWGLGAAMLVRREAVQPAGLFDERFFLYFEDVDLCLRLHRTGWQVLYNPAAVMIHEHRRDSARPGSWLAKRHHFVSLTKFLWKHRFRLAPAQALTEGHVSRA